MGCQIKPSRSEDLYWPKEPELAPASGKWTGEVNEGGNPPNGRFEVMFIDVPDSTSAALTEWLRKGNRTKTYPGIREAEADGARTLDRRTHQLAGS
jgi:hypothetical protein